MRPVVPLVAVVSGAALFGAGAWLLRGFGSELRVARTLAAAPDVRVAEAVAIARAGDHRYVRVHGRVASDEEFPDEHDRPLVFRRRRVQLAASRGWETIEDRRVGVPFAVEDRADAIGVDLAALDEGLVVLPRESSGRAADVPEHVPPGTPPDRPVRLRIEQVSAVEHAQVAGVTALDPHGNPWLTRGLGRPLIVSTLDMPDAMRVLGGGRRDRARVAAALIAAGPLLVAAGVAGGATGMLR
jgi:hypothetical protein